MDPRAEERAQPIECLPESVTCSCNLSWEEVAEASLWASYFWPLSLLGSSWPVRDLVSNNMGKTPEE